MKSNALPPLNWLRAFEASARHLSFTAAAHELNMTQSAVSQQIRSLEQFLGKPLFIRRARSIQPNDAGLSYLPVVQEAFEKLSFGTRALVGGDRGNILTIQSNLAFSVFWLAPRLGDLLAKHPWLNLNIVTAYWTDEQSAPPANIEIRFGRNLEERFNGIRLTRNTCFPVCRPGVVEQIEDVRDRNLFDCIGIMANWEAWLKAGGEKLLKGKNINLSSTYSISLNAALAGAGLAMGHETLVGALLEEGRLERPFEHSIPMEEAYYFVAPPDHAHTPATRAFSEWLLSNFDR